MKTKVLLVIFLIASLAGFSQRAKQHLRPDDVTVKNRVTTTFLTVSKTAVYDDIKTNTVVAVTGDTAAITVNWNLGNIQKLVLNDTVLVTFTTPSLPCKLTLYVQHAANSTNYPIEFTPTVKWVGGTNYTPTNTSGAIDILEFNFNGTTYYSRFDKAYAD